MVKGIEKWNGERKRQLMALVMKKATVTKKDNAAEERKSYAMKDWLRGGASGDAILLTCIKLITLILSFVITRLMSQYLSVYDYGTYSQIMLIVSTVSSLTILGMIDGVNYFNCSEPDAQKREAYISTIFTLQCIVSAVAGSLVFGLAKPLCVYFDNPDIARLLVFAVALPFLQNLLSMIQVLVVSVGKARMLAIRNLIVAVSRLLAVIIVVAAMKDVSIILATVLVLDILQIVYFGVTLRESNCEIHARCVDFGLVKRILNYCIPMAVFIAINALNRDLDKYLVALWTDTETLAVYSNASRTLPFDIIMASFCTVLQPEITRLVAGKEYERAVQLYKVLLEIAYIPNIIMCCAALTVSPQLIKLLYSEKYMSGLEVFCIYILVDMIRFTNMTLVLSAAGKAKTIMFFGASAIGLNAVLNVLMYQWIGLAGPAAATLISVGVTGILMLSFGARALGTHVQQLFDGKHLLAFALENLAAVMLFSQIQNWLSAAGLHYVLILLLICGAYGMVMILLHGKRLLRALKMVNTVTRKD